MKLFVSFDGDHIGRMVGRASLADNPEEVSRIAQGIERGNRLWASWAEAHGGKAINVGGDEGRLEIEADYLSELPGIREQYEGAVGSTCSVGVGTKLSEADKSLMAAKLQGGDRIQLYTEEVDEILAKMKEKTEAEKLQDEYLDPDTGLQKADPAMNTGNAAGFAGASHSTPAAPQKPTEGSEHSENEVLQSQIENAPPPPEAPKPTAADYEQLFHQLAGAQKDEPAGKPSGVVDGVREQVVKVLQNVRAHAVELEQMKQGNPELYQSVVGVVQAMIAMARGAMGEGQPEQVQKAEGKVGRCKWKLGERRCQRTVTGDYCHDHKDHWANKIKKEELQKATQIPNTLQTPPRVVGGRNPRFYTEQQEGDLQTGVLRAPEQKPNTATALKQAPPSRLVGEKSDPAGFRSQIFDYSDHHSAATHHLGPITVREIRVNGPRYGLEVKVGPHEYSTNIDPGKGSVPEHERLTPEMPPEVMRVIQVVAQKHMKEKGYHAGPDFERDPAPLRQNEKKIEPDPSEPTPDSNVLSKDLMPGGKGDNKPDSGFDPDQLLAGMRTEMSEHGLDEARAKEVAKDHLTEDPHYYSKMDKAALEAGKTGRHQVVLPVGSQVDAGPSAAHEAGEIKLRDPDTGKTKWREVRAGIVMAPDGTPTSSRNPSGG